MSSEGLPGRSLFSPSSLTTLAPFSPCLRSYRYFNNINRLAAKFPIAHTANPRDEVNVWCSNDYLGMSKSTVVVETMKCVFFLRSLPYLLVGH